MDSPSSRSPGRFALLSATAHGGLWIVFGAVMVGIVPRCHQIFREFHQKIPDITQIVFALSRWLVNYWYFLAPFLLLFFAVDARILFRLRRNAATEGPSTHWSLFMLAVPLVLSVLALGAVILPLIGEYHQDK